MVYRRPIEDDEEQVTETSPAANADFSRLLDESFKNKKRRLNVGDKIRAEVLSVGKDNVIVSTGTVHDGFVPSAQLLDEHGAPRVRAGESLDLYVTSVRGSEITLSPNPGARNLAESLGEAYREGSAIEGRVEGVNKGGFSVLVMNKLAFCPVSQIDSKRVEKPEEYIGKRFEFHITKFDEGGRNIVVSRRKLLDEERALRQRAFMQERKPGDVIAGVITRLEKFGAFVDLGAGLEGLAHISELSWSRVSNPAEAVEIGQAVSAKILRMEPDPERGDRLKISLSLKQSEAEPWQNLPPEIEAGRVVSGKVTRCMKFGAFVEISPGIEGLVPLSEMSFTKRVARSDELIKENELVTVKIKDVDPQAKRISLSLREAGEDPWAGVTEKYAVGTNVKATFERREAFGLFLQLEEGITGLLPKSKALEDPKFPFDKLRPGDVVNVKIGALSPTERRISLELPDGSGTEDWKNFEAAQKAKPVSAGSLGVLGAQLQKALERQQSGSKK